MAITVNEFNRIRNVYGQWASWAVWANNVNDLSLFDSNSKQFSTNNMLNPNIIFIALNPSRSISGPYESFHKKYRGCNDYKLKFALQNTSFCGSYMTDLIKGVEEPESSKVINQLRNSTQFLENKINDLKNEIIDINPKRSNSNNQMFKDDMNKFNDITDMNPLLIAMGKDAYNYLLTGGINKYFNLIKIPHFSFRGYNKDKYKNIIHNTLPK